MIAALTVRGYSDITPIGEGGLGDVYRATRTSTGGHVAFKVIRDDSNAAAVQRRIEREVAALVKLKGHPYVVQVEEVLASQWGPIVVMEYAANGSLADRIAATGQLAPAEYVLAAVHVAEALRAAHHRKIVHRDIKPHNLLVGDFGQVKVCDFGISAMERDAGSRDQTSALSYRYASPEELDERGDIGPAADIYSLGMSVRHLATGTTSRVDLGSAEADAWCRPTNTAAEETAARAASAYVRTMLSPSADSRPCAADVVVEFERIAHQLGSQRLTALSVAGDAADARSASRASGSVSENETVVRLPRTTLNSGLPRPDTAPKEWW